MQHNCQTSEWGVENTLQSPVGRGKGGLGDSAFMRLVFSVSLLVEVSLSMTRRGSLGGRRFSGSHARLVGGEEEAEKESRKRTN